MQAEAEVRASAVSEQHGKLHFCVHSHDVDGRAARAHGGPVETRAGRRRWLALGRRFGGACRASAHEANVGEPARRHGESAGRTAGGKLERRPPERVAERLSCPTGEARLRAPERAASSRDSTPSFDMTSATCHLAPARLIPSASAISPFGEALCDKGEDFALPRRPAIEAVFVEFFVHGATVPPRWWPVPSLWATSEYVVYAEY